MSVPWEENSQRVRELLDQGRQARDAGQLAEAAALFREAYEIEPSAFAASRYLHCMRWQGGEKARAAVRFAREPVDRWPMDTWLVREYVWAIYDGYLKTNGKGEEEDEAPGEEQREFAVMVKAARRILKLSWEELPRLRTVFAICREARARRQWALVLEFALTLDPVKLPDQQPEQDEDRLPSPLQRWLYYVTRAHLELGHYDECLKLAREGIERYPQVMFFPWWHALARIGQGYAEQGLAELKRLPHRYAPQWYVLRDIAQTYEKLSRDEEAWRWYCAAARSPGELKGRIPMLVRMGQLLERLDRCELALEHLLLAWVVAAREERWEKAAERNREQVEAFLQRHAGKLSLSAELPEAPSDPEPFLTRCQQAWKQVG